MVGPSEAARGPRREDSGHNDRSNNRRGSPAKVAGHSNTFPLPNPSNTMRHNN